MVDTKHVYKYASSSLSIDNVVVNTVLCSSVKNAEQLWGKGTYSIQKWILILQQLGSSIRPYLISWGILKERHTSHHVKYSKVHRMSNKLYIFHVTILKKHLATKYGAWWTLPDLCGLLKLNKYIVKAFKAMFRFKRLGLK